MNADLTLYELTGSPNNVKVRMALGYKGLEYERDVLELDGIPGDRSKLIQVSGQPRTPVLKHGDTVIFDSGAILRYLDANFRDTPALFSTDYQTFGVIEGWELWSRTHLGPPVGAMFSQVLGGEPDAEECRKASALMTETCGRLEEQLGKTEFLVRDTPSAADMACAPMVFLAMMPESAAEHSPIGAAFRAHFHLGEGRDRTRAWVEKLIAYDPVMSGAA